MIDLPDMFTGSAIRSVPGFLGYAVTDAGEVWSCLRRGPVPDTGPFGRWKRMSPGLLLDGYLRVTLRREKRSYIRKVQRLVMEAFVGPRPPELQTCHNNGIRGDNRLENLRYDTLSGNQQDRKAHGTSNQGEQHGSAVLTEQDVRTIRHDYVPKSRTHGSGALAKKYRVSDCLILLVVKRKLWRHVL